MSQQLSVVMPVYNEQEVVVEVLEKWYRELALLDIDFRINVYNDGSKDNTSAVLHSVAQKLPRVVIHDKPNSGHGPTILKGYQQNSDCEWIFQTDSDDEMSPKYFEKLWKERDRNDFLLGCRSNRVQPFSRRIISLVSRLTVWWVYGRGVWDVNAPFRLMRVAKFKPIFLSIPHATFAPNVIISAWAAYKGLRILEIDVPHSHRNKGTGSIKNWNLLKVSMQSFSQTVAFRWAGVRAMVTG